MARNGALAGERCRGLTRWVAAVVADAAVDLVKRRAALRVTVDEPASLTARGKVQSVQSRDLSDRGAQASSVASLTVGDRSSSKVRTGFRASGEIVGSADGIAGLRMDERLPHPALTSVDQAGRGRTVASRENNAR